MNWGFDHDKTSNFSYDKARYCENQFERLTLQGLTRLLMMRTQNERINSTAHIWLR